MHDDELAVHPAAHSRTIRPDSILIIDDNPGTVETYSTVLRLAGFRTAVATTGEERLALALAGSFDVILVDLRLPDMSGIDVVRELTCRGTGACTVVVTAFPTVESSFDVAAAGGDGYVDGPLFGEEVIDVVAQAGSGLRPVRHPRTRVSADNLHVANVLAPPVIDPRVKEVTRAIDSDLARPWRIGDLAARVNLSESRLRHLFHASLGLSISHYVSERRLQLAARHLIITSDSVRQIAFALGFNSCSLRDFRRSFKKRFGMAPIEYRARLRP
jgi:AraC-like DNA-binding protein